MVVLGLEAPWQGCTVAAIVRRPGRKRRGWEERTAPPTRAAPGPARANAPGHDAPKGLDLGKNKKSHYTALVGNVCGLSQEVCLSAMLEEPRVSGFHGLALIPELLAALDRVGYQEPTP